jgi:hypothetical protein
MLTGGGFTPPCPTPNQIYMGQGSIVEFLKNFRDLVAILYHKPGVAKAAGQSPGSEIQFLDNLDKKLY